MSSGTPESEETVYPSTEADNATLQVADLQEPESEDEDLESPDEDSAVPPSEQPVPRRRSSLHPHTSGVGSGPCPQCPGQPSTGPRLHSPLILRGEVKHQSWEADTARPGARQTGSGPA
ncbi:MAG: hypothetical protein M1815_000958 [Lichina confinis]|nr:MAG: hypothetical protein M1815_000958 [Lichina confinis]